MQVVIELPDDTVEHIKAGYDCEEFAYECFKAIKEDSNL